MLLTAIQARADEKRLADMMLAAATDHFYMDTGHVLDFHNKALEILERIGPEYRPQVLTSLLPQLSGAQRSEELHNWQSPVDLVTPLLEAFDRLQKMNFGEEENGMDEGALLELMLGEDPARTVQEMTDALEKGMSPVRLARLVALAAAKCIEEFHVQNDFSDWITVLHTFTHAHAVHRSLDRSFSVELLRAVYHGAMSVYLDRFLNIPRAKGPKGDPEVKDRPQDPEELLTLLNQQQQVAEAAEWVATYLDRGGRRGGSSTSWAMPCCVRMPNFILFRWWRRLSPNMTAGHRRIPPWQRRRSGRRCWPPSVIWPPTRPPPGSSLKSPGSLGDCIGERNCLKKNIEREMGVGFDVNLRVMEKGWPAEIPLQERNWGMADFRVLDPDGDYLRITSPKY